MTTSAHSGLVLHQGGGSLQPCWLSQGPMSPSPQHSNPSRTTD